MNDVAPDGAEIRNLINRGQGATRLGLAEALVPPSARTAKVYHRTTYEEIWYILRGTGVMHLHQPDREPEEIFTVEADDAVLIPAGHGFWVENSGSTDLVFLCCGSPPWPGADEARPWPPVSRAERAE
jgi:mannose-6-phosphate isomerase-like protein (cupin superfamily)